ncbi:transcription regulator [Paucilactobacillus vaccinostercus DSM 20634]|uniref:Transcription regulator n=1 Tax=Paucilactobacillus vaccinostercus DSM 20634 TaxID=1423813 RepID=A0A0R2AIP0_9LACO|nr:AraC family transcriptional regulator [Paucilactobacillus vaccinostercus]KRM62732.1 transcription regulator [Paucilactobacillus vaccinostercus DSM 20634]
MENSKIKLLNNSINKILKSELVTDMREYYAQLPTTIIEDQTVYIFDGLIPKELNFKIAKHDRFLPVPTHIHTFIELNYIYSGTCNQIIDGKKVQLHQGDLIIIDTEVPHSIAKTDVNDIIINILIRKEYFSSMFFENLSNNGIIFDFLLNAISYTTTHNQYIVFHTNKNNHLKEDIRQILWETYFPTVCSYPFIENYLNLLFIDLLRVFEYDAHNNSSIKNHAFEQRIDVLRYIEDNFDTCTLKSVSSHFNYSPNYLSTFIRKSTGKTYSRLIREYKMAKVCFYLANTNTPVDEIAEKCGFSNLTFFYKKFNEIYEKSPKEYRATNR